MTMEENYRNKYNVEDKPFYNSSGSFYLSFLMRGSPGIDGNIKWVNNNTNYIPRLPYDTLYSSSVSQPGVLENKWQRYIYHASMSYFLAAEAPKSPVQTSTTLYGISKACKSSSSIERINSCSSSDFSGLQKENISTLSN